MKIKVAVITEPVVIYLKENGNVLWNTLKFASFGSEDNKKYVAFEFNVSIYRFSAKDIKLLRDYALKHLGSCEQLPSIRLYIGRLESSIVIMFNE